jgi:tripartite-type tricarboxylate transporter receptor subunit TctC
MNKRRFLQSAALLTAMPLLAQAQGGTGGQTVRIVLAVPPGGASDTAARLLAQSLSRGLGQPVVVENRPGGNGVPAVQAVLAAPADGTTLLWAMASMTGMPQLVKSSPVKSMAEFTPVAPVVNVMYGLLVNPKVPAHTLAELGAYLKANPDRLSFGTAVLSEYMVAAQYLRAVGARAQRVPYRGGAQLMPDLMTGEVQFYIGALAPALPHVKSGKLRLLATLPDRVEAAPGVSPLTEAGVQAEGLPVWNGLLAPPKTPRDVVARLSQEVNRALADPALRAALEAQGLRVTGGSPAQMAEAIESASAAWRQFIRDYDIPQEGT